MAELESPSGTLPPIPDDLTLVQFILDSWHLLRPAQAHGVPWIIEDHTGVSRGLDEVSLFDPISRGVGTWCLLGKTNWEGWLYSYAKEPQVLRTG